MPHRDEQVSMLGHELELLMGERQRLLQVVGATAALVASLDSSVLPQGAIKSANLVSSTLNALPEETLRDALAAVRAEIQEEERVVGS